ncbi:calcium channel protein, partial [Linderina pennispora]
MRPFLRHTYNRLDLISLAAFWVAAAISSTHRHKEVITLLDALAAIRFVRFMSLTPGSHSVIGSLKRSAPMLGKVSLYMGFFFLVFACLGVTIFRGAFSRRCISAATLESAVPERYCCSYMENGRRQPYLVGVGTPTVHQSPRAYACPQGQICMTVGNPSNSLMNYDNIFASAVQVFIVASAQGWADI